MTSLHVSSLFPYPGSIGHSFPFLVGVVKVPYFLSLDTFFLISVPRSKREHGPWAFVSFLAMRSVVKWTKCFSLSSSLCVIFLFLRFIFIFYFLQLTLFPHLPLADCYFLPLVIAFDRDFSHKQSLQEKKPTSGRMAHLQIATTSSSFCLSFPSLQPLPLP